jgi:cytochrome b561
VDAKGPHRALAAATHATFYLLLGALPVLGLIASQARGQAVQLLGLPLPDLLARDRDLAEQLLGIHEWLAWLFLAMAGMHAVMALWHHWVRGDDTLRRMLPTISVR